MRGVRIIGSVAVAVGALAAVGGLLLLAAPGGGTGDDRTSADLALGRPLAVDLEAGHGSTLWWVGESHGGFPFFDQAKIDVVGPGGSVPVGEPTLPATRVDWPSSGDFSFPVARFEPPVSGRYTVTFDTTKHPTPRGHPMLEEDPPQHLVTFGLLGLGVVLAVGGGIALAESTDGERS